MSLIYKNADGCYCDIAGLSSLNIDGATVNSIYAGTVYTSNVCNSVCPNMSISSNCNLNICACNNLTTETECMFLNSKTTTCISSGSNSSNTQGAIVLKAESYVANCEPVIMFAAHCSGCYIEIHKIEGNGKLTKVCYDNSCEYPYALMCDLPTYVNSTYEDFNAILSAISSCKTVVPGVFNLNNDISFSDSRGNTYCADELVGTFFKEDATTGHFNGLFCHRSNGVFSVNFWYRQSNISSQFTVVTPVP